MRSPSRSGAGDGTSSEVQNASIAFGTRTSRRSRRRSSTRSTRRDSSFFPGVHRRQRVDAMDRGLYMFVVSIPRSSSATSVPVASFHTGEHRRDAMQQAASSRLHPVHHTDRISSFSSAPRRRDRSRCSSSCVVVQPNARRPGSRASWHHQPDQHADDHLTCRGDPRTRARDARAPAGDAMTPRDRNGEGVGQQSRDPDRHRGFALPDRPSVLRCRSPARSCCGSRRHPVPVLRDALGIYLGTVSR